MTRSSRADEERVETDLVRDRPRLLMVVDNRVVGDSRVAKSARTAVKAGYDTIVLGRAFSPSREDGTLEGARLIRVPVTLDRNIYVRNRPRRGLTSPLAFRHRIDYEHARRMQRARVVDRKSRILGLKRAVDLSTGPRKLLNRILLNRVRLGSAVGSRIFRVRAAHYQRAARKAREPRGPFYDTRAWVLRRLAPGRFWRAVEPLHLDFEMAYGPVIDELAPDLIHAHDFRAIGIAVRAKWRAEATGRQVGVVYDAHEHVPGLVHNKEFALSNDAHVAEYIRHVDAVVTVSPSLAEALKRHYRLRAMPRVVLNTPQTEKGHVWPAPNIRERLGLPETTPLIVHSGSTAPERGLGLVVRALQYLPELHFAIITGDRNALAQRYVDQAHKLGVADRLHLARYVPHDQVIEYLASATLACIPMTTHTEKHHVAAPTKFYEYLHSKLPMVVSDTQVVADMVRRLGVGEIFRYDQPNAIVPAIRTVLDNLAKYQLRLAEAGEARDEYSWERQAGELVDIWQAINRSSLAPASRNVDPPGGLLVGRLNAGGHGAAWMRAIRARHPGVAADAMSVEGESGFANDADVRVAIGDFVRSDWQSDFLNQARRLYSHVLVESLHGFTPSITEGTEAGLSLLERTGFHVGVVFHGSDIRDPELHEKLNPNSPFPFLRAGGQNDYVDLLRDAARERRDIAQWFGDPIFVSAPDLIDHVDRAHWLPISLDADRWKVDRPALDRDRLVVLHVPSNSLLEGSDLIDDVLSRLAEAGLIDYLRADAHEELPPLISRADVVVDQLHLGTYGLLACQAMAAGRLVISEVGQRIRRRVPIEIPIIEADRDSLDAILRGVVRSPASYRDVAVAGPRYVRRFHDGRYACSVLAQWLGIAGPIEREILAEGKLCHI